MHQELPGRMDFVSLGSRLMQSNHSDPAETPLDFSNSNQNFHVQHDTRDIWRSFAPSQADFCPCASKASQTLIGYSREVDDVRYGE